MNSYDYRIAGYFVLAMLEVGIEPAEAKRIVAMAQVKMDEMSAEEAHEKAIGKMKMYQEYLRNLKGGEK